MTETSTEDDLKEFRKVCASSTRFVYIEGFDEAALVIGRKIKGIEFGDVGPYRTGILIPFDREKTAPIKEIFAAAALALDEPRLFPSRCGGCHRHAFSRFYHFNMPVEHISCPLCRRRTFYSGTTELDKFIRDKPAEFGKLCQVIRSLLMRNGLRRPIREDSPSNRVVAMPTATQTRTIQTTLKGRSQ